MYGANVIIFEGILTFYNSKVLDVSGAFVLNLSLTLIKHNF
jgi:hypothetical protein